MRSRREVLSASLITALPGCSLAAPTRPTACDSHPTQPDPDTRIGFAGDVMLGRGVNATHTESSPSAIWGDFLPRLHALDGFAVNLECCISTRGDPAPGRTYHFRANPSWAIPALSHGGVTFTSLANNHTLDYGVPALHDTLTHLDNANIAFAGAGQTTDEAVSPVLVTTDTLTIGFIAFTDQSPTYAATANHPGTAYIEMDHPPLRSRWTVRNAVNDARAHDPDILVASLHWGPNWVTTPSVAYRSFAHWLIDEGVDLIHGHSAHVIQGIELYRGKPILHDTGDFIDDYAVKPGLHNDRSFLFELAVSNNTMQSLRLVPIEITDQTVHHADPEAATWLRSRMRSLSKPYGTTFRRDGNDLVVPLSC